MSEHPEHDATDPLATQLLKIGVPPPPGADATQALPAAPGIRDTQPLKIEPAVIPDPGPAPGSITTQTLKVTGHLPEARPAPARSSRALLWGFGILAVGILGGSLAYYFLYPSGEAPAVLQPRAEVPPVLGPYLERANQGDAAAMRLLGTMYYNGLNVPRDRNEGIRWYRKAAAAGSVAARKDLEQLGLAAEEK